MNLLSMEHKRYESKNINLNDIYALMCPILMEILTKEFRRLSYQAAE